MTTATRDATGKHARDHGAVAICDVCFHPDSAHDRVAERYCRATHGNALSRACICSTTPSPKATPFQYRS
jgi:hypothetical protein